MRLAIVACVAALSVVGCAASKDDARGPSTNTSRVQSVELNHQPTERERNAGPLPACLDPTSPAYGCPDPARSDWQGQWTGTAYAVRGDESTPVTCTFSIADMRGYANDGERMYEGTVTCLSARGPWGRQIEVKEDGPGLIVLALKRNNVWQRVGLVRLEKNGVRTYFDDDDGDDSATVLRPMQIVRR